MRNHRVLYRQRTVRAERPLRLVREAGGLRPGYVNDELQRVPFDLRRPRVIAQLRKPGKIEVAAPFSAPARKQPLSGTAAKHSSRKTL